MYPMLTAGAYGALLATGADWMKQHIVPKMVSGEWAGTMCLTEPGCGTDLRLMKTRAVEQPDGTYRMNGTKIFISGGDQDLTDNIIHMVIAKIPDENGQIHDDLSTVNFFMVPKFLVERRRQDGRAQRRQHRRHRAEDGHQGPGHLRAEFRRRHGLAAGPQARRRPSRARSAPPRAGMAGMFGMMNAARLGVGIQGIAIGEVAYQNGYAYAHERRVGHALTGPKEPDKPPTWKSCIPTCKRMLLHAAPFVGRRARAGDAWTTLNMSIAPFHAARGGNRRPARRPDDAGDQGLLHRHGLRGRQPGACNAMAATAISATMAWSSSCAMAASTRSMKAPMACRRWTWSGRKLGRKGGAAPLALFALLTGWIARERKRRSDGALRGRA